MFTQKKIEISFRIMLIILGIFTVFTFPLIGVPVLGGVITQGILGGFSGKVGPVVGGKWKDIDYMRGFVTPANPNTTAQQTVRTKFSAIVELARLILTTILQPYWDPYHSNMSGFNAWIKENYSTLDGSNKLQASSVMAKGTLTGTTSLTSEYTTGDGYFDLTWDPALSGNAENDDYAVGLVFNKLTNLITVRDEQDLRQAGDMQIVLDSGLTPTNLIGYVFFYRGTGSELIVSDSIGDVAAAP